MGHFFRAFLAFARENAHAHCTSHIAHRTSRVSASCAKKANTSLDTLIRRKNLHAVRFGFFNTGDALMRTSKKSFNPIRAIKKIRKRIEAKKTHERIKVKELEHWKQNLYNAADNFTKCLIQELFHDQSVDSSSHTEDYETRVVKVKITTKKGATVTIRLNYLVKNEYVIVKYRICSSDDDKKACEVLKPGAFNGDDVCKLWIASSEEFMNF